MKSFDEVRVGDWLVHERLFLRAQVQKIERRTGTRTRLFLVYLDESEGWTETPKDWQVVVSPAPPKYTRGEILARFVR